MRVDLRGRRAVKSEKPLDESDIDASVKELGSCGMTKHVGSDTSRQVGLFACLGKTGSESCRR